MVQIPPPFLPVASWPDGDTLVRVFSLDGIQLTSPHTRLRKYLGQLRKRRQEPSPIFFIYMAGDLGPVFCEVGPMSGSATGSDAALPSLLKISPFARRTEVARTRVSDRLIWYFDNFLGLDLSGRAAWNLGVPLYKDGVGSGQEPSYTPSVHHPFDSPELKRVILAGFPFLRGSVEEDDGQQRTEILWSVQGMNAAPVLVLTQRSEGLCLSFRENPTSEVCAKTFPEVLAKAELWMDEEAVDTWMDLHGRLGEGVPLVEMESYLLVNVKPPVLWSSEDLLTSNFDGIVT